MLPETLWKDLPALVPDTEDLRPEVPTVYGPIEYRQWRQRLERIDEILRDGVRTLMKATQLIRGRGLRARMKAPEEFLRAMNQLAIQMTQQARRAGSRRARKAVLRRMKRMVKTLVGHARRHRELLAQRWRETDWSEAEARQVMGRIDAILERLPHAVQQAHERIIGGRQVANEEKILSLYEGHAAVYVRGKAGAEVEFGSQLLLSETSDGLIADWELVCGNPEHDTVLLARRLERDRQRRVKQVVGDRSFDSRPARTMLAERAVKNGILPRDRAQLREQMRHPGFALWPYGAGKRKRGSASLKTYTWACRCVPKDTPIRRDKSLGRRWRTTYGCSPAGK